MLEYPSNSDLLTRGGSEDLAANCPAGTFVTGGDAGAFDAVSGEAVGNQVVRNQSIAGQDGYTAHFANALASGNGAQVFVEAICANANQVVPKPRPGTR